MAKTISTHNGSTANRDHNIRNPKITDKQDHIDKSLRDKNKILHDENPREAYKRIFGKALNDYNANQKRPDRIIKDYYNHICRDEKKHAVYEMIVQIGDRNDTGIDAPVERKCLKEFYEGWKKRNPHLECIGAYIHADETEGTVHMHLDYVPVATGYKKGMSTQNGLVKALGQQGFLKDGSLTAQIKWEARENAALEQICRNHGIEIYHPMIEGRQHLEKDAYILQQEAMVLLDAKDALMDEGQELAIANADLIESVNNATQELQDVQQELQDTRQELQDTRQGLQNARQELQNARQELQNARQELQSQTHTLTVKKEILRREVNEVYADLKEARIDLEVKKDLLKRIDDQGVRQFTMAGWQAQVAAAKQDRQKEDQKSMLAKFAEMIIDQFPAIRQLWEKFRRDENRRDLKKKSLLSQDKER